MDMDSCIRVVEEEVLKYRFKNKKLLEDALTHPSCNDVASYERLAFLGDSALGLAVSNFIFLEYPNLDKGNLSLLRSVNVSTEKLARVAVRLGLYIYMRRNAVELDDKVRDFVIAVQEEDEPVLYGGVVKAPKVLADIVEAVAAAVYVDCGFDLKALWMQQPQPVTMLFELCQKHGKQVSIEEWRIGEKNIASVYVDGQFVVSSSSDQKDIARLQAAQDAFQKLQYSIPTVTMSSDMFTETNGMIEGAKQKLHELCGKKKWQNPVYRIEKLVGPSHDRKFISSVHIEFDDGVFFMVGDEKPKLRQSKNSVASLMLQSLLQSKYI